MEIEILLEGLDDKRVQDKLLSIVSGSLVPQDRSIKNNSLDALVVDSQQEKVESLERENEELKVLLHDKESANIHLLAQVELLEDQRDTKVKEFNNLDEQLNSIQFQLVKLEELNQEKEKKLSYYRENFEDDLRLQDLYLSFSEQTRLSLSGIFRDISLKGLIACGIQEKNISNLWDYAKNEVVNGKNNDIDNIIRLFEQLFARFVLAYPMLSLQRPSIGDEFDNQVHIRHNNSLNMSGSINQLLLPGYINTKTGKVVKQSIVII